MASFSLRIDDFPGERANSKEDKRESSDRESMLGGDGCNKTERANETVEGEPAKWMSSA